MIQTFGKAKRVVFGMMMLAMSAAAQVTTTGPVTSGTVPVFSGTSAITNSPISVSASGNNVGIGTTTQGASLSVQGGGIGISGTSAQSSYASIAANASDGHWTSLFCSLGLWNFNNIVQAGDQGIIYSSGSWGSGALVIAPWANATSGLRMDGNGNVGIGTTAPLGNVHIQGTASASNWSSWNYGKELLIQGNTNNPGIGIFDSTGSNPWGIHNGGGTLNFSVMPAIINSSTAPAFVMSLTPTGNVGIGTTSPGSKLEVNGNIKLTAGSGASILFPDNTTQATAWTGSLCGGDYAESVDVSGDRAAYEPGDVMMVDADNPGHFLKAAEPYSTLVAGIYSTKPGVIGRRQTSDPKTSSTEVPMAMVGIVPTKVSTENGPIRPGDLLVTSSTVGYVMKGTDSIRMIGSIVGKSLGNLKSGTGVIEVLVSLQ